MDADIETQGAQDSSPSLETELNWFQKNKMPFVGFLLLWTGPIILTGSSFLLMADLYHPFIGSLVSIFASILPLTGVVLAYKTVFKWREVGKFGLALAIVTIIMGNPLFLYIYLGLIPYLGGEFSLVILEIM